MDSFFQPNFKNGLNGNTREISSFTYKYATDFTHLEQENVGKLSVSDNRRRLTGVDMRTIREGNIAKNTL